MRRTTTRIVAGAAALSLAASASAATAHRHNAHAKSHARAASPSRLDDGKDLLSKATITEQDAIRSAQSAASGALNEVDLEYAGRKLVYTVDVGSNDVKVDAADGKVVTIAHDD